MVPYFRTAFPAHFCREAGPFGMVGPETLVTGEAMQLAGQGTSLKARPVQPKHGITSPQRPASTQVGIRHGWNPSKDIQGMDFSHQKQRRKQHICKGVYKHNDISTFFCSLFGSF